MTFVHGRIQQIFTSNDLFCTLNEGSAFADYQVKYERSNLRLALRIARFCVLGALLVFTFLLGLFFSAVCVVNITILIFGLEPHLPRSLNQFLIGLMLGSLFVAITYWSATRLLSLYRRDRADWERFRVDAGRRTELAATLWDRELDGCP